MSRETTEQKQARLFGGAAPWDEMHAALEELAPPRGPEVLYDLAREADLSSSSIVVDVGGYAGTHAIALTQEYRCRGVVIDLVAGGLVENAGALRSASVEPLLADAQRLPVANGSVDLIWARDMLTCVEPRAFLRECTRVLRPGGHVVLHAVYLTDLIEGRERERFVSALALTDGVDRARVETAIEATGLAIAQQVDFGAGWRETELVAGGDRIADDMLAIMRLQRAQDQLVDRFGAEWYETILAWRQWAVFMALGKLDVVAYLLRTP